MHLEESGSFLFAWVLSVENISRLTVLISSLAPPSVEIIKLDWRRCVATQRLVGAPKKFG